MKSTTFAIGNKIRFISKGRTSSSYKVGKIVDIVSDKRCKPFVILFEDGTNGYAFEHQIVKYKKDALADFVSDAEKNGRRVYIGVSPDRKEDDYDFYRHQGRELERVTYAKGPIVFITLKPVSKKDKSDLVVKEGMTPADYIAEFSTGRLVVKTRNGKKTVSSMLIVDSKSLFPIEVQFVGDHRRYMYAMSGVYVKVTLSKLDGSFVVVKDPGMDLILISKEAA